MPKQNNSFIPKSEWPFVEVLSDDHTRSLETVQVYITDVEPKNTSQLLKFIGKHLPPLQHLEHYQFVLSAILCSVDNIELSALKSLATEHNIYIQPQLINIPKHAPLNKQQYREWNSIWPINYREILDKILNGINNI
ncbi:unnamed protein product [Cunninghamella echinulata]